MKVTGKFSDRGRVRIVARIRGSAVSSAVCRIVKNEISLAETTGYLLTGAQTGHALKLARFFFGVFFRFSVLASTPPAYLFIRGRAVRPDNSQFREVAR